MIEIESTLFALLLVFALGLLIPELLRKFRLPFITIIIIAGAIFGPSGLGYIKINEIIEFFGFLGMTFLMLIAGMETDISKLKKSKRKVITMSALNGLVPFLVGIFVTRYFGYPWIVSIIVGIVFISSSVAIIVPSLKSAKIFDKDIGQYILSAVLIADITSLIALGFIFQSISPITKLPLPIYYIILITSIAILFSIIPKLSKYTIQKRFSRNMGYERQLRFIIVIVIAILLYFSILGVHPILAAFLAGLTLSGLVREDKSGIIRSKIHTLGYGLFVPVFFFVIGMGMDLRLFKEFDISNILMISLILGLITSKLISGFVAGKIVRLSNKESLIFGSISIVQLTTTLAVTLAASSLGLLDNVLVTSIILLSIVTTLIGPVLVTFIIKKDNP